MIGKPHTLYAAAMERILWRYCKRHFDKSLGPEHGPQHWKRVRAFGEILCDKNPNADRTVTRAFACLHDIMRHNNLDDPEHGVRAAALVKRLRWTLLSYMNSEQLYCLYEACRIHSQEKHCISEIRRDYPDARNCGNPTVDACIDADRLDLLRCGIFPDPYRMCTMEGAELAARVDYNEAVWQCVNNMCSDEKA